MDHIVHCRSLKTGQKRRVKYIKDDKTVHVIRNHSYTYINSILEHSSPNKHALRSSR